MRGVWRTHWPRTCFRRDTPPPTLSISETDSTRGVIHAGFPRPHYFLTHILHLFRKKVVISTLWYAKDGLSTTPLGLTELSAFRVPCRCPFHEPAFPTHIPFSSSCSYASTFCMHI